MDDFDIYGDLEYIQSEAKNESQEHLALQCRIKELQDKLCAVEQEKNDIIKKNDILLENVSSLLLTAKAELKRKDAVIGDLRKQCDNVVFRRGNHIGKGKKCASKFTQTAVKLLVHSGIQTVPVEETAHPVWSKSWPDNGAKSEQYQKNDRKKNEAPRQMRDHDEVDTRGVRQRDKERKGYHDRCKSDREQTRYRCRSQHRTKSREQNRLCEYSSYELSRDRDVHVRKKNMNAMKDYPSPYSTSCMHDTVIYQKMAMEEPLDTLFNHNLREMDYSEKERGTFDKKKKLPERTGNNGNKVSLVCDYIKVTAVDSHTIVGRDLNTCISDDNKKGDLCGISAPVSFVNKTNNGKKVSKDTECIRVKTGDVIKNKNEIRADGTHSSTEKRKNYEKSSNIKPNVFHNVTTKVSTSNYDVGSCNANSLLEDTTSRREDCDEHLCAVMYETRGNSTNFTSKSEGARDVCELKRNLHIDKPYGGAMLNYGATEKRSKLLETNKTSVMSTPNSCIGVANVFHMNKTKAHLSYETNEMIRNIMGHSENTDVLDVAKSLCMYGTCNGDNILKNGTLFHPMNNSEKLQNKNYINENCTKNCLTSVTSAIEANSSHEIVHMTSRANVMNSNVTCDTEKSGCLDDIDSKTIETGNDDDHQKEDDHINVVTELNKQIRTSKVTSNAESANNELDTDLCFGTSEMSMHSVLENRKIESIDTHQNRSVLIKRSEKKVNQINTTLAHVTSRMNETNFHVAFKSEDKTFKEIESNIEDKIEESRGTCKISSNEYYKSKQAADVHASIKKMSKKTPKNVEVKVKHSVTEKQEELPDICKNSYAVTKKTSNDLKLSTLSSMDCNKYAISVDVKTAKETNQEYISNNLACRSGLELHHVAKKVEYAMEAMNSSIDTKSHKHRYISNSDVFSNENNTRIPHSLRARRANSCYVGQESSENRQSETITIQTCFDTFDMNGSVLEQTLSDTFYPNANITKSLGIVTENSSLGLNVVAEVNHQKVNNESQKLVKNNSKIAIEHACDMRERLRKRLNINLPNTVVRSELITVAQCPKRRLSMESATSSSKKHKSDIDMRASTNKLLASPTGGNLSSSYFSQIALPITSALDSIPSKLQSPILKRTEETAITPMVVVHSPAKPSNQLTLNNNLDVCYYPLDDYSTLEQIMDSLFQTPIKNEDQNNAVVAPGSNNFDINDSAQNVVPKECVHSHNLMAHSTPLNTKPLSRIDKNDGTANKLKLMDERVQQIPIPLASDTMDCAMKERNVHTKRVANTTRSSEKLAEPGTEEPVGTCTDCSKKCTDLKNKTKNYSTNLGSTLLNHNNTCETLTSMATVTFIQPTINSSNSSNRPSEVHNFSIASSSKRFKAPGTIRINTLSKQTNLKLMQEGDAMNSQTKTELPKKSLNMSASDESAELQFDQSSCKHLNNSMPWQVPESLDEMNVCRTYRPSSSKCPDDRTKLDTNCSDEKTSKNPRKTTWKQTNVDEKKKTGQKCKKESKHIKDLIETSDNINNMNQIDANNRKELQIAKSGNESEIAVNRNFREKCATASMQDKDDKEKVAVMNVVDSAKPINSFSQNISLADNGLNNSLQSPQKREAVPAPASVRYVREMRIVKESPSLMRVFIRRK
ncbi:uncharacterized protein LOC121593445 [Anopheles merus]|uniref:uncharacterized protein LOC121593445 n=1 Tax=Anopheles merus TaxID=30066 RepID=UPI001BE46265|nr:uncharacterized protein LOC121593445 [Anopheles merus]